MTDRTWMLFRLAVTLILLVAILAPPSAEARAEVSPQAQVRGMGPGINLFSYDSLWTTGRLERIRESHLDLIAQAGFKTLRFNLMAFRYIDSDGRLDPKWLASLDHIIDLALARGFQVIVDEHDFEACREDIPDCRIRLAAFWTQVAERYANYPDTVMFEILNEPSRAITPAIWNEMLRENLAIIRKSNPTRNVLIGPANFNKIESLPELDLPSDDHHIILTIHYYHPLEFTHQRFPYGNWFPKLPERKWGSLSERTKMRVDFQTADAWASSRGVPVVLGEFGSFGQAPEESRATYAEAAARTAETLGWAWIYWQFDKHFKIYEIEQKQWHDDILRALIPAH